MYLTDRTSSCSINPTARKYLDNNYLMQLKQNIGKTERLITLISGSYLLYKGLSGKKSPTLAIAGGLLLLRGSTGYCPLYHELNIDHSGQVPDVIVKSYLTVNKPREEVYSFWRKLDNLPLFMKHLDSIEIVDEKHSDWKAKIPGGIGTVSWKAEITDDVINEQLSWSSLAGSTIENSGTVKFTDAGEFGTELHVEIAYRAPAGALGEGIGKLLNPIFEGMIREDIKNFRRYIETGELPTIKGQASGKNK